jgi:phosphoesterase RecJ-like protein
MDEINKRIWQSQKIAIFCHENADGDAIGCTLWLWTLLQNMWKTVKFVVPGWASKVFSFLKWYDKLQWDFDYGDEDLLILVDCSEYHRLWDIAEWKEDYFDSHDIVVFDHHHIKSHPWHRAVICDSSSTSCCEVILENTKDVRAEYYTPEIATYLYLWLTTDSGNFRYDENPERIHTNAITLLKMWADKKLIIDNLINCKSLSTILFLKRLLDRMVITWDIVYTYYDVAEFDEFGIDGEQAWYGLTIIQEIKWPKVAMTIRKTWDSVKCSLRSKDTNVQKIAASFGGWWHLHASWFSTDIQWDFDTTIKDIVTKIQKML